MAHVAHMIWAISEHFHFRKVGLVIVMCIGLAWYVAHYFHSQIPRPISFEQIQNAIASNDIDLFTIGLKENNNSNLDVKICSRKCPPEYTM